MLPLHVSGGSPHPLRVPWVKATSIIAPSFSARLPGLQPRPVEIAAAQRRATQRSSLTRRSSHKHTRVHQVVPRVCCKTPPGSLFPGSRNRALPSPGRDPNFCTSASFSPTRRSNQQIRLARSPTSPGVEIGNPPPHAGCLPPSSEKQGELWRQPDRTFAQLARRGGRASAGRTRGIW